MYGTPTCFGITLPSSGSVPSAFWVTLNWGAFDRILWIGVFCLVTWCVAIWDVRWRRHRWQYGACALHAGYLRLQTQTLYMYYWLLFYCYNSCKNAPQCYVARTLPVLFISRVYVPACGPGISVGIATSCGLDGPGIESRWGEIFRTCPDRPWGPPSLLYNGHWVFPGGRKRPGRDADPSPLLVPRSKHRVELYLYSPWGPSWPVKRVKLTYVPA
jgi:hypothetical protein